MGIIYSKFQKFSSGFMKRQCITEKKYSQPPSWHTIRDVNQLTFIIYWIFNQYHAKLVPISGLYAYSPFTLSLSWVDHKWEWQKRWWKLRRFLRVGGTCRAPWRAALGPYSTCRTSSTGNNGVRFVPFKMWGRKQVCFYKVYLKESMMIQIR